MTGLIDTAEGAPANNSGAWMLVQDLEPSLRDIEKGLGHARRAVRLAEESGDGNLHNYLNTLAVALHRAGDREGAIETEHRAIALFPENEDQTVEAVSE